MAVRPCVAWRLGRFFCTRSLVAGWADARGGCFFRGIGAPGQPQGLPLHSAQGARKGARLCAPTGMRLTLSPRASFCGWLGQPQGLPLTVGLEIADVEGGCRGA